MRKKISKCPKSVSPFKFTALEIPTKIHGRTDLFFYIVLLRQRLFASLPGGVRGTCAIGSIDFLFHKRDERRQKPYNFKVINKNAARVEMYLDP